MLCPDRQPRVSSEPMFLNPGTCRVPWMFVNPGTCRVPWKESRVNCIDGKCDKGDIDK